MLNVTFEESDMLKPYFISQTTPDALCDLSKDQSSPEVTKALEEVRGAYMARRAAHDYVLAVATFLIEEIKDMTLKDLTGK